MVAVGKEIEKIVHFEKPNTINCGFLGTNNNRLIKSLTSNVYSFPNLNIIFSHFLLFFYDSKHLKSSSWALENVFWHFTTKNMINKLEKNPQKKNSGRGFIDNEIKC